MLVVSLVSFSVVLRWVCIFLLLVCVLMWLCVIARYLPAPCLIYGPRFHHSVQLLGVLTYVYIVKFNGVYYLQIFQGWGLLVLCVVADGFASM